MVARIWLECVGKSAAKVTNEHVVQTSVQTSVQTLSGPSARKPTDAGRLLVLRSAKSREPPLNGGSLSGAKRRCLAKLDLGIHACKAQVVFQACKLGPDSSGGDAMARGRDQRACREHRGPAMDRRASFRAPRALAPEADRATLALELRLDPASTLRLLP